MTVYARYPATGGTADLHPLGSFGWFFATVDGYPSRVADRYQGCAIAARQTDPEEAHRFELHAQQMRETGRTYPLKGY